MVFSLGRDIPWNITFNTNAYTCVSEATDKTQVRISPWCDNGRVPDNKAHGANMGPIRGRQDPGESNVGAMNFAIWGLIIFRHMQVTKSGTVQILDWIYNVNPLFIGHVITYPYIF